jgi:hypothetical protein
LNGHALWQRWGELTRFLGSVGVALANERHSVQESGSGASDAPVRSATGKSSYTARPEQHLAAISDTQTLYRVTLLGYYALAEAAASERVRPGERSTGGIEGWGTALLSRNDQTWDRVLDGKPGAVEVAVVRDSIAHASSGLDLAAIQRLRAAGSERFALDEVPQLDHESLMLYKDRLRSLLRMGGIRSDGGAVDG